MAKSSSDPLEASVRQAFTILEDCEHKPSRLVKEKLIQDYWHNPVLQDLFALCYSNHKFRVHPRTLYKQSMARELRDPSTIKHLDKHYAYLTNTLLPELSNRRTTGNAAVELVEQLFSKLSVTELKWYTRLFDKDLNVGFGMKSLESVVDIKLLNERANKILGFAKISTKLEFPGAMQCQEYKAEKQTSQVLIAEHKLDGYRLCLVMNHHIGTWSFFTRTGHCDPYNQHLAFLAENLVEVVRKAHGPGVYMVDGEILHDVSWNATGVIKKKTLTPDNLADIQKNLTYHIFDFVDLSNIHKQLLARKLDLRELFTIPGVLTNISALPFTVIYNQGNLDSAFAEALEAGTEGLILKDPHSVYQFGKRTKSWTKLKPLKSQDVRIIKAFAGDAGTRNESRLGRFLVMDSEGTEFHVGIGFTDANRDKFWRDRKKLVGRWMEIRMQDDKSNCEAKGRFNRFVRMRKDL